jgi:predicted nucleic acid-binding protein
MNHDVSDYMYLALALQENANSIITTDSDFEKLSNHAGLKYLNPIPKEKLGSKPCAQAYDTRTT